MTRFYFAFPDRAYHYDCAQCDALCCRGHGIGATPKETPALLARYPALAFAATRSGATGADFINPSGGCFFLTEANLCQIETELGRAAKPGVCTLFPFNDFSRFGEIVIVRPHFLCPLRLLPGEGVGRHAEIEKQLRATGVMPRATEQPGRDVPTPVALAMVKREEAFRDRCAAAIGKRRYEALLEEECDNADEFRAWRERALRIWGLPHESAPRDYLDDLLLALAPPIRTRALLGSERKRLRILFLAGAYLRAVAKVTARPLALQGAHQLIMNVMPVLRLFARGNVSLRFPEFSVKKGADFQNPEITLAFFQVLEELEAGKKLLDVLERAVPERLSRIDRVIFFDQLGRRVRELSRG